uniref:Uncharacterized protein n=1 Tax=viral metagenome TaxID=1070528 RepID=A0A6C0JVF8_9ZZZZ
MWLFFGLPIVVLFIMGCIHASETLDTVRLHWNEYRCNPLYIPFAGMIRPDIGVEANFQHCMNLNAQSIFKFFIDELMSLFATVTSSLSDVGASLPNVRSVFSRMRKVLFSFGAQTFGKIVNSMSNVSFLLIKIRDVLKRFVGEGYIATFLAQTGIDFVISFIMAIMSIIKSFVYALLAISIVLALFQPEILAFAVVIASLVAATGF